MANSLNENLTDRRVILSPDHYEGDERDRTFLCESGFGCETSTRGHAIFGRFVKNGRKAKIDSRNIERLTDEEAAVLIKPQPPFKGRVGSIEI